MKTFIQFLYEAPIDKWGVSWKKSLFEHIMSNAGFLYLPPKLVRDIFGHVEVTSFHGTTIDGLKKLKSIQHTRKTVSSFTRLTQINELFVRKFSGDYPEAVKHYDVLCRLEGLLVMSYESDMMSIPDDKGVRGTDSGGIIGVPYLYTEKKEAFKPFMERYANQLHELGNVDEYKQKGSILSKLEFKFNYLSQVYDIFESIEAQIEQGATKKISPEYDRKLKRIQSTFKYDIIKTFYEFNKNVLKEYKNEIIEHFMKHKYVHRTSDYNEVLVSNFAIKELAIMSPDLNRRQIILDGLPALGMLNKTVNYKTWEVYSQDFHDEIGWREINEPIYKQLKEEIAAFIDHDREHEEE